MSAPLESVPAGDQHWLPMQLADMPLCDPCMSALQMHRDLTSQQGLHQPVNQLSVTASAHNAAGWRDGINITLPWVEDSPTSTPVTLQVTTAEEMGKP